jgi:hypothetical protein
MLLHAVMPPSTEASLKWCMPCLSGKAWYASETETWGIAPANVRLLSLGQPYFNLEPHRMQGSRAANIIVLLIQPCLTVLIRKVPRES